MSLLPFPLLLPQAREARGGTEFPGFRTLALGNRQGVLETGFGLGYIRDGLAQQQGTLEPIRLSEHVTPPARF